MDFSRLDSNDVVEFIVKNGFDPEEDIYAQADRIFNSPNPEYTYPVVDLFIASQLDPKIIPQTYTPEQIRNFSPENKKIVSELLSIPIDENFNSRVIHILTLMDAIDLRSKSLSEGRFPLSGSRSKSLSRSPLSEGRSKSLSRSPLSRSPVSSSPVSRSPVSSSPGSGWDDDDWEDDWDEDDWDIGGEVTLPNEFWDHVELYKSRDDRIIVEEIPGTGSIEVDIWFDIGEVISENAARSWRTDPSIPVHITLLFSDFPGTKPPKISIHQVREEWFGLKFQLENILQALLDGMWKYVQNFPEWLSPEYFVMNNDLKGPMDSEDGLFYLIKHHLMARIKTLQRYCIICDTLHILSSDINMVRRTVCHQSLCWFSYQYMGVAKDEFEYMESSPQVIDLIFKMTRSGSKSTKRDVTFDPYPLVTDPENPGRMILNPDDRNYQKLESIINVFPDSLLDTFSSDYDEMKAQVMELDDLAFPLLQWIISSNRANLVNLSPSDYIHASQAPDQYLMLTQPPEKESKFREMKEEHNSVFAFHGSPFENWHAIIRKGLKNASGTNLQRHGAAYGSGIYLSPSLNMSFGYSNKGSSTDPICVAICEVINKDIRKTGDVWVVEDEDLVYTRFLLVYPPRHPMRAQIRTDNLLPEIYQTMTNYGLN